MISFKKTVTWFCCAAAAFGYIGFKDDGLCKIYSLLTYIVFGIYI